VGPVRPGARIRQLFAGTREAGGRASSPFLAGSLPAISLNLRGSRALSNMDRAMLQRHLAVAERHIAEGERSVARQRDVVVRLDIAGLGASETASIARGLLGEMEATLRGERVERERLRAWLGK